MHCGDGDGGDTTREGFSQAHGCLVPSRRSSIAGLGMWCRCWAQGPRGDGGADAGMGMLRCWHCKGVLSLYRTAPAGCSPAPWPCGYQPARSCWGWVLQAGLGHGSSQRHPIAAALFQSSVPLFLPFHSFPSAHSLPPQASRASPPNPTSIRLQTQPRNKIILRAKIEAKLP